MCAIPLILHAFARFTTRLSRFGGHSGKVESAQAACYLLNPGLFLKFPMKSVSYKLRHRLFDRDIHKNCGYLLWPLACE